MTRCVDEKPPRCSFAHKIAYVLVVLLSFLLFAGDVFSQAIPKAAEPERFFKKFEKPELPKSTFDVVIPRTPGALPPSELENIKVVLTGIEIDGNTTYKRSELSPLFKNYLGREISLKDVYQIAADITAKYRNDGYILSSAIVPPQRIDNGIVRIKIVEGYVDAVDIEGDVRGRRSLLESYAQKIKNSRPLQNAVLERYLLLMGELPGVKMKSVLTPSDVNAGSSKLTLKFEHHLLDGSVSMDRRGTRFTGPFQGSAGGNLNSAMGLYERTGFRMITTSPATELLYVKAYHDQHLGTEGTTVNFNGTVISTHPGHTLKDLDVVGATSSIGVSVNHPFIRSRQKNLSAHFGFSRNDTKTTVLGVLSAFDQLRIFNVGVSYDFLDSYRGINLISVDIHQGADIFNATESGSANLTRDDGKSDFTRISGHLFRLQQLIPHWTLLVDSTWQYAMNDLLGSQEYGVGGAGFARAYDASEIAADSGIAGKVELQWAHKVGGFLKDFQLYGFADYGSIWNRGAAAGSINATLASAGLGVRFNLFYNIAGYLEVAEPMARTVDAEGDREPRFFFSIATHF